MSNLLIWLFYFFSVYAFLPGIVSRLFGYRVLKRGPTGSGIALTFDDGPDPVYTMQLLDLLKRHRVKATFFIIGKNAENYPHIVRRMHEDGHVIGIHNYTHRSNWLMHPNTVKQQIERTRDLIVSITNEEPLYYRPPWGILNVFDFTTRHHYQIVLWSIMIGDWRSRVGVKRLLERMRRRLADGQIYLLHDCGMTLGANQDAPRYMLEALESFIPETLRKGYSFVGIDSMMASRNQLQSQPQLWKQLAVHLWMRWERVFHTVFKLQPITPKESFLHMRVITYSGPDLPLSGGETLTSGDRVAEIHLDNGILFRLGHRSRSPMQLAIMLIRAMERALPMLVNAIRHHAEREQIKALYGITMINRGVEPFGFTVAELPRGWFSWGAKVYLQLLMRVIHPHGSARVLEGSEALVPKVLAMSIVELNERYGEQLDPIPPKKLMEA